MLAEAGITTFEQDVTKPFDSKWLGHFDLIHLSLLNWILTEAGWKKTFENVHRLLSAYPWSRLPLVALIALLLPEPGGQFVIVETDPIKDIVQASCTS